MSLAYIRSLLLNAGEKDPLIPEPPQSDSNNPDAPSPIVTHRLDFVKLGLPEYKNKFAMVIDNLFTPEDCARYVAAAEASKDWDVAAINGGQDFQYVDTTYRNSSRILLDDHVLANEILERLRPYLKDIDRMDSSPLHRTYARETKSANEPPARLAALNERLRFLKYGPGQFFRSHCDGIYSTPDRTQVSYYTLQLYLNGSSQDLEGGSTRFWKSGNVKGPERRTTLPGEVLRKYVDVEARMGRALVFEQRGLVHSGEDVKKGVKLTMRTDLMYEACPETNNA